MGWNGCMSDRLFRAERWVWLCLLLASFTALLSLAFSMEGFLSLRCAESFTAVCLELVQGSAETEDRFSSASYLRSPQPHVKTKGPPE